MPPRSSGSACPARPLLASLGTALLSVLAACGSEPVALPDLPAADARRAAPEPLAGWRRALIDGVMKGRVWQGARTGYVALVARDGRVVHAATIGHRDLAGDIPMTMDTQFQIASMTKPVVATAAMILVQEGRLGLDDPVSRYVPELARVQVAELDDAGAVVALRDPARPIRVRDVLSFSSGMGPGMGASGPLFERWREDGLYSGVGRSLADRVAGLAALPLFADPGVEWRYGASMDVVARVVEVVAGEPLDVFLDRRIFAPLGMRATHYYKDLAPEAPLAVMTEYGEDGTLVEAAHARSPRDWTPGGTGLVSTAPDYMRFALMLWNDGEYDGVRILDQETVALMTTPVIDGVLAGLGMEGLSFGLGLSVVHDADSALMAARTGDFWWSGAYGTHAWISPETGIVLVVMQQRMMHGMEDPPIAPGIVQAIALGD